MLLKPLYLILALFIFPFNISCSKVEKTKKGNYTSLFLTSNITTLNNDNFDKIVRKGLKNPVLVLFTVKRCPSCNYFIQTLEKALNILNQTHPNITSGKLDCFESSWTAMRFKLSRLPILAYIENNTVSYLQKNMTIDNVINFVNDNNKIKEPFPKPMSYTGVAIKFYEGFDGFVSEAMSKKGIPWNKSMSLLILIIIILIIIFVQWKLRNFCFRKKKEDKTTKTHHSHTHSGGKDKMHKE